MRPLAAFLLALGLTACSASRPELPPAALNSAVEIRMDTSDRYGIQTGLARDVVRMGAERDSTNRGFLYVSVNDSIGSGETLTLDTQHEWPIKLSSPDGGRGIAAYPLDERAIENLSRFQGRVFINLETISRSLSGNISPGEWAGLRNVIDGSRPSTAAPPSGPARLADADGRPSGSFVAGVIAAFAGIVGMASVTSQIDAAEDAAAQLGVEREPDGLEGQRVSWAMVTAAGIVLMVTR